MDPVKRGLAAYKKNSTPLPPDEEAAPVVRKAAFPQLSEAFRPQGEADARAKSPLIETSPVLPVKVPEGGFVKTTVKSPAKDKSLRKVAKFIILLGKEEAAKVIRHLSPEEVEEITREIAQVKTIEPAEAEKILQEFGYMLGRSTPGTPGGGPGMARSILEKALGAEKAQALLKKAVPDQASKPFDFLGELDPAIIALLLKDESIPVLSIVVPHLPPPKAAAYMKLLPLELQMGLVKRLAKLERVSKEILESIEAKLRDKVRELGETPEVEKVDGQSRLAEILKFMGGEGNLILNAVAEADPQAAQAIRSRLYTPDMVLSIRDMDLETWLRDWEDSDLARVLQVLDPAPAQRLRSLVSTRRLILLDQEMNLLGTPTPAEAARCRQDFLARLRRALEEGLLRSGDRDDYI